MKNAYVIISGNNCRLHEADFESAETTVEVFANDQNIELMADVLKEEHTRQKKGFALISLLHSKFVKSVSEIISKHIVAMKVVR